MPWRCRACSYRLQVQFWQFLSRYFVTAPVILFSLFTVFFTGFLILELQVRLEQSNWQTIISFFTNLCLAMGWLIDKGTWILPVSQLHSKGFTCNHHSNFWRSLPQSRGVAKWHGWVYNYFWEWLQDQASDKLIKAMF